MEPLKRNAVPKNYNERRNYAIKKLKYDGSLSGSSKKKECAKALIFDNGGFSIKIGYTKSQKPVLLPNHVMKAKSERKRFFIADQIEDCRDLSGLYYLMPHECGYITKFDIQKTVWDYTFHKYPIDDSPVIMTQPILNFRTIQEYMDEIFYEEYDVKSLYRANATDLTQCLYASNIKGPNIPCIVVDSGYSFTHIVPYINGQKYMDGVIRMDIGGKLLTNYLKDVLSYRQLHVMEETYVINQLKEDICFMSQDFKKDMYTAKYTNDIVKNYVLPDFHSIRRGFVQDANTTEVAENLQILRINNERISVPEVLMKPSIVPGLEQAGLAQCIAKSIAKCPEKYQRALAGNIILTGGNCLFQGFKERVESETRMYLPCEHQLSVYQPADPVGNAWFGGQYISSDSSLLRSLSVSKQDYEEYGSNYTYKKFNEFSKVEADPPKAKESTPFSYLDHWKKEGVDIFQKSQMTYEPTEDDLQFILEGDGIEELDGKYVTIEFEYNVQKEPEIEVPVIKPVEIPVVEDMPPPLKLFKKKKVITKPVETILLPTISRFNQVKSIGGLTDLQQVRTTTTKVYKPIFRQRPGTSDPKMPQFVSIGKPMSLNGNSIILPKQGGGTMKTVTINSSQILNNTVILPQNMLGSKNVTLQLIPIRPDMLRQGANFIITKKPPPPPNLRLE